MHYDTHFSYHHAIQVQSQLRTLNSLPHTFQIPEISLKYAIKHGSFHTDHILVPYRYFSFQTTLHCYSSNTQI